MNEEKGPYVITEKDVELYEECLKFLISYDQYRGSNILTIDECTYGIEQIRSRPLSEEIRKAREDVLDIIQRYNNNDPIECPSKMKAGCDTFKGDCVDCVIQSLREGTP